MDKKIEEQVNHPDHYNKYDMEIIEMMRKIWGDEAVAQWCEMTAFKYRRRVRTKAGNSIEQDLEKEKWYLDYGKRLRNKPSTRVWDGNVEIENQ